MNELKTYKVYFDPPAGNGCTMVVFAKDKEHAMEISRQEVHYTGFLRPMYFAVEEVPMGLPGVVLCRWSVN